MGIVELYQYYRSLKDPEDDKKNQDPNKKGVKRPPRIWEFWNKRDLGHVQRNDDFEILQIGGEEAGLFTQNRFYDGGGFE